MTTQTINYGSASAVRLIDRVRAGTQMALMWARHYERKGATERAIAGLTAEQLDDIGIRPRDEAKPVMTVKAGTLANLMSLR